MVQQHRKIWAATLTPHRSLSRRGFHVLMGSVIVINLAAGIFFYLDGAWPVIGFMGLDVALLYWAFERNYKDAWVAERIEITAHELVLRRCRPPEAEQEERFVRNWVRVELEEYRDRDLIGPLYLSFKGRRTEIASFLSPNERRDFAKALQQALVSRHIG